MADFLSERKLKIKEFHETILKKKITVTPVDIPDGIFVACEQCNAALYQKTLTEHQHVCPHCGHHFRINAHKRLEITVDQGSFHSIDDDIISLNPLHLPGYEDKITKSKQLSQMNEAFIGGSATIVNLPVAIGILDSTFMMGSMGSAVGEKVTRLIEFAIKQHLPLIIFSASGGARMQEGILSLMQMAKTSAALKKLSDEKLLYISVLTNPTTGGVAASFASLGDINIAEKSSLIGFAGKRVIKQTIMQELPEGFQTDQFQLEHGQVDMVVLRKDMRKVLFKLIKLHPRKVVFEDGPTETDSLG
jgi:acetyl-CoA carboxylase carboxyl transferase subunit beta